MIVKCPQCNALVEASEGTTARCNECGFSGEVSSEKALHGRAQEMISPRAVERRDLWAPFAVLAGVGAIGTFYLARFFVPFLLAAAAIGLGLLSQGKVAKSHQAMLGVALGALGLLLQIVALWWL